MEFLLTSLETSTVVVAAILTFVIFLYVLLFNKQNVNEKSSGGAEAPPEAGGAWPVIGHLPLLGGPESPHRVLGRMADAYGPIFRIRIGVHRALVVSNWETAKECLTTHDRVFASRPKTLAMEILGYNFSMIGFSPYGPYWRQVRKIATTELLSNHRLESFKHVRQSEVTTSLQELYDRWDKNFKNPSSGSTSNEKVLVEMKKWFEDVTANVILRIVVGKRCNHNNSEEGAGDRGWKEQLTRFFALIGKFVVSDALPFLRWLDVGGDERLMKKMLQELDVVVQGWLDEHKRRRDSGDMKGGHEDFMGVMQSILDQGAHLFPDRDADTTNKATCLALVLAASSTNTLTMTWTLSLLLNHRDVLKKVQNELDVHVGKERLVNESDVKHLVYLQAVVKESIRLYPAAPLSLPHESMEDCTINGYLVPVGTRLLVNIWKIHRDPRIWEAPSEFRPERFLTTHKDLDVRGQSFEYIPFSSGRRMCPGVSFALQVTQLTLAAVLHGFDFDAPSEEPIDMTEGIGLNLFKSTPLEVLVSPRLSAALYESSTESGTGIVVK